MKRLFSVLPLLLPLITIGQNPHDSLKIIYKSNNLIEIVKPLFPEIAKATTSMANSSVLTGVYIDSKRYGILENGEVKIYDRFYQLIEHIIFRDSLKILEEEYHNGKMTSQCRHIPKDSIMICTYYYTNGNPEIQDKTTSINETTTKWYENGLLKSICIYQGKQEKCDYWDEKGIYKNGIITMFKGYKDFIISEIEIDRE